MKYIVEIPKFAIWDNGGFIDFNKLIFNITKKQKCYIGTVYKLPGIKSRQHNNLSQARYIICQFKSTEAYAETKLTIRPISDFI